MTDVKKDFEKIHKKYGLPSFEELDVEFEIGQIENTTFFLREIRKKIYERIEPIIKVLEEVLQPDTNINNLYECKEFSEDEKSDIFRLYKQLMVLNRWSAKIGITHDENEEADYVKKAFNEINDMKKPLAKLLEKLTESWKKESDIKEDLRYMG